MTARKNKRSHRRRPAEPGAAREATRTAGAESRATIDLGEREIRLLYVLLLLAVLALGAWLRRDARLTELASEWDALDVSDGEIATYPEALARRRARAALLTAHTF